MNSFSLSNIKQKVSGFKNNSNYIDGSEYLQNVISEINLQTPNFHSGVVVAYSNYNLYATGPANNSSVAKDIKYSWYRSGASREQIVSVDGDSKRSWYGPTADDIGFKICVQCEDTLEKGFSRYKESTLIAADPLLCSSVEAAIGCMFYEANDVAVSIGTHLKPTNEMSAESFNPKLKAGALASANMSTSGIFHFQMESFRFRVELNEAGVMLRKSTDNVHESKSLDKGSGYETGGLFIKTSEGVKFRCRLPICTTIEISLKESDRQLWDPSPGAKYLEDDSEARMQRCNLGNRNVLQNKNKTCPWLWLGLESTDPFVENFNKILSNLSVGMDHTLYICLACNNRTERDSICLVGNNLCATTDPNMVKENRISKLPWHVPNDGVSLNKSESPTTSLVGGLSTTYADSDLMKKINNLEIENAKLKKQLASNPLRDMGDHDDVSDAGDSSRCSNYDTVAPEDTEKVLNRLKNQLEEFRYEISTKDITIEVFKQSMSSMTSELESIKQQASIEKMVLESKLEQLQKTSSAESEEKQRHISRFMAELEAKHSENLALNEEVRCSILECNELKTKVRTCALTISESEDRIAELEQKTVDMEKDRKDLSLEVNNLKDTVKLLESDLADCKAKLIEDSTKLSKLTTDYDELLNDKNNTEMLYLQAQNEATKNAGAFVMLEAADTKQKQTEVELTHAIKKNDSLAKELRKTLKDAKELQKRLEAQLEEKTNECGVLEEQLAHALSNMISALPTDTIPLSPTVEMFEGGRKASTPIPSTEPPVPLPQAPTNALESLGIVANGMYRSSKTAVTTLFVMNDNKSTLPSVAETVNSSHCSSTDL